MPNDKMKPGIPNPPGSPDFSQPTAAEVAESEARRQESYARQEQLDAARRLVREEEERLVNRDESFDQAHGSFQMRDRVWDNDDWDNAARATDPNKRRRMREIFRDSTLPNLPPRPGFHRCWVSTTHNNDTPARRMRLGYWFLKADTVRAENWHSDEFAITDATNQYTGCLMWREMIAMETDNDNFRMIMRELHHDQPHDQERSIYETLDAAGEQIRDRGGRTTMAPGMERLRELRRPPQQFET